MSNQIYYQTLSQEYLAEMSQLENMLAECQYKVENHWYASQLREDKKHYEEEVAKLQTEFDRIIKIIRQLKKPKSVDILVLKTRIHIEEQELKKNRSINPDEVLADIKELHRLYNFELNYSSVQDDGDPWSGTKWRPKKIERVLNEIKRLLVRNSNSLCLSG